MPPKDWSDLEHTRIWDRILLGEWDAAGELLEGPRVSGAEGEGRDGVDRRASSDRFPIEGAAGERARPRAEREASDVESWLIHERAPRQRAR